MEVEPIQIIKKGEIVCHDRQYKIVVTADSSRYQCLPPSLGYSFRLVNFIPIIIWNL